MADFDEKTRFPWPFRVACLGGGFHSAVGRSHNVALSMDRRFKVEAGCFSRNSLENAVSAAEYGVDIERAHGSLDELLEKESGRLDAIVLLTPTDQHASQVIQCLDHRVPVICEKALGVSSAEVGAIQDKLKATEGFLAVTYNYLGYPMLRELRAMIAAGDLGKVHQIQIEMPQEGFIRKNNQGQPVKPQDWRLRDYKVPTISLDLGVHLHSIIAFLTGEQPEELVATSSSFGNFHDIVDDVTCIAKYSHNLRCNFWFSKTALGYRNGLKIQVFGDKGAASWAQVNPETVEFSDCYGNRSTIDRASSTVYVANEERYSRFKAGHPAGFVEAFANYYYDVGEALQAYLSKTTLESDEFVFGTSMAMEGLKLLEAMDKSSRSSSWVDV